MKTKRIPFDIAKAKAGAKVVTRDGHKVDTIRFDRRDSYPISGWIRASQLIGDSDEYASFTEEGYYISSNNEDCRDLFIEEDVEEDDNYNPYKATVESIADMVERYSDTDSDLKDFYDNVKVKCREAVEYDNTWNKKQDEQKTKIEPKFKVGDWIVQDNAGIYKVTEICESWYEVIDSYELHYSIDFNQESMCRLWTIQDAKPGDVLHAVGQHNDCIFIFNRLGNDVSDRDRVFATGYCCLDITADKMEFCVQGPDNIEVGDVNVKPATKIQCDLLFQKMKESRYEWDSYRMELKRIENEGVTKIELNSKFKIGDKVTLISNKLSFIGTIMYISDNGLYRVRFPDLSMYWYTEDMLEPYEIIEDDDKVEEDVEPRLMTNQELADWLRDAPEEHREYRYAGDKDVYNAYDYPETEAKTPVDENRITIRRYHGKWQKPLIEE